jgi:copper chaperone CopZ
MKTTFIIQNLKCNSCAHTIKTKLSEVDGVNHIEVVVESSKVTLDYIDSESLTSAKLRLKSLGYPEADDVNSIVTKAKSFVSCATGKMSNHEK